MLSKPSWVQVKPTRRAAITGGAGATAIAAIAAFLFSTATVRADSTAESVAPAQPTPQAPVQSAEAALPQFFLPAPPPPDAKALKKLKQNPFKDRLPVISPIENGKVTGFFGTTGPHWAVAHSGFDISAATGTTARAVVGGKIRSISLHPAYGIVVQLVRKDGVEIWYCHLSKPLVFAGQEVAQGTPIALTGATGNVTGPHLHIEVRVDHVPTDPMGFFVSTPGKPDSAPAWAQAYREVLPEGNPS